MSDLIDRQYVIDALELGLENDYIDDIKLLEYVKQLPSAEPERKKGEWIPHENYDECSKCHFFTAVGFNFCPNCGADMRGKE